MPVDSKYFEQFEPDNDYFNQYEHEGKLLSSHEQEKPSEIPNKINSVADKVKSIADSPIFQRFLHGPSEEDLGGVKLNSDDADVEIPGLSKLGALAERKLSNTGNYAAGFLGGLIGHGSELLNKPLGFAMPGEAKAGEYVNKILSKPTTFEKLGVGKEAPKEIPKTQKLLPSGQYTVNRVGEVFGGEQIPRQSMRESLKGKPVDIEAKPVKSEVVPSKSDIVGEQPIRPVEPTKLEPIKLKPDAQQYIELVKSGKLKGVGFPEFQKNKESLLAKLISDETGTFAPFDMFKSIRGVKDEYANNIRQAVVDSILRGGELNLEGIRSAFPKVSKKQFNNIVDEIIDSGVINKIAAKANEKIDNPAVDRLLEALSSAKPMREEQEAIYSAERSKRFSAFMGVKTGGMKGAQESLSKLKGPMEKVGGVQLDDVDVDQLFNSIKNSKRITPGEMTKGYTGLFKLLEGAEVPQRSELQVLDRVFGNGFGQQIIQMHGGLGPIGINVSKTANTMKTMMASADFSAPFRQGLGLAHRKEFYNSFANMFKYAGSEDAFVALKDSIESHPNFLLSRDAGLFLASHDLHGFEEAFMDSYVNDIHKFMGNKAKYSPARASERAYVGFLNKLRFDTFNNMLEKLTTQGYNAEEVAGPLAKYINVSTGRGELGRASKYADALNTVLFSPRLISSRLTILNPKYYVDAPDYIRKEAIKTLLTIGGFVAMADEVGSVLGGQLKGNPLSSDFGKIKFGNTRLDPGGGFLQYVVLASRLARNKVTTSANKTIDMSKGGFKDPNRWSLMFGDKNAPGFIENKGSPMATFISGMLRGKDFAGQPFDTKKELADRFTPLIIQDIRDVVNSDPDLLPLGFPAAFGMGVQTYQTRQKGMSLSGPSMSMDLRP